MSGTLRSTSQLDRNPKLPTKPRGKPQDSPLNARWGPFPLQYLKRSPMFPFETQNGTRHPLWNSGNFPTYPFPLKRNTDFPGTPQSEPLCPSSSRDEGRFLCFVWKGIPTFPLHLKRRPVSQWNLTGTLVGHATMPKTLISPSTWDKAYAPAPIAVDPQVSWINIKTIFSEKHPYRKGHTDPIFTSALNTSSLPKSLKISVTLLKRKKKKDGKKRYIHTIEQLLKYEWGCGLHYTVETIYFPDFGDYVQVLLEHAPILNKTHRVFQMMWQMWALFPIARCFLYSLNSQKVNYVSKQTSQYRKRKSD